MDTTASEPGAEQPRAAGRARAAGNTAADIAAIAGNLRAATGGAAPHHAWQMMADLADACGPGGGPAEGNEADEAADEGGARVVAAIEAAMALAPRDPLEAMLVTQMTAVHAAAMRCLRRAAECTDWPQIEARYLREATRLMHLFVRQTEALDRRARMMGAAQRTDAGGRGSVPGSGAPPIPLPSEALAKQGDSRPPASDSAETCEKIATLFARKAAEQRSAGRDRESATPGGNPLTHLPSEALAREGDACHPASDSLDAFVARLYARQREKWRAEGMVKDALSPESHKPGLSG